VIRFRPDTGKWEVRWRQAGRHRSRSFTRKADAERLDREVSRLRELGGSLDLNRGKETLAEFVERWWVEYAIPSLSKNTRDSYGRVWEKHLRGRVGGYRLRDVTPAVVDKLKAQLTAESVGAPTVRKALAILSGVFRCAVTWDRIDSNPVREVRLPQARRQRLIKPIPPARVEAMRAWLLRAYCGRRPQLAARQVMRPQARWSIAR